MRLVDEKIKNNRKRKILQAVIHEFIRTVRPVSSRAVCSRYNINLSSATVRNLMEELERENFLTHLHTSSGRMPTDKGYRLYVDSLLQMQRDWLQEEDQIRRQYHQRVQELGELLQYTSHLLSALSNFTGFVLAPPPEHSIVKKIQLVPVGAEKILVLLITHNGLVRHSLLNIALSVEQVWRLNEFLNEKLSGKSMKEVRTAIDEVADEFHREQDVFSDLLNQIEHNIFSAGQDIFLQHPVKTPDLPEFRDIEAMNNFLQLNEQQKNLMPLLRKVMRQSRHGNGARVLIGRETNCPEMKDISVVSAVYRDREQPLGVLGILGPKRMNYNQMIKLVNCVAKVVGKMIEEMEKEV